VKELVGPVRRALIYGLISYAGLVVINNAELDLPNMWIAYLPMFIGVFVATQWLDRKFGE
jgi:xanthine/uracil permease